MKRTTVRTATAKEPRRRQAAKPVQADAVESLQEILQRELLAPRIVYYNFGRIHKTLRVTPAMEAGIADHVWTLEEIAALVQVEAPKKRGPYKKKNSN